MHSLSEQMSQAVVSDQVTRDCLARTAARWSEHTSCVDPFNEMSDLPPPVLSPDMLRAKSLAHDAPTPNRGTSLKLRGNGSSCASA